MEHGAESLAFVFNALQDLLAQRFRSQQLLRYAQRLRGFGRKLRRGFLRLREHLVRFENSVDEPRLVSQLGRERLAQHEQLSCAGMPDHLGKQQ